MTATFTDYLTDLRVETGDFVEAFNDQEYTDQQFAVMASRGTKENNRRAFQRYSMSGSGPHMTYTPTPSGSDGDLLLLFWAKAVAQSEAGEAKRVGFSVSNVAGRVSGRERYNSARDGVRDIETRIRRDLKVRGSRQATQKITYRPQTRAVTNSGSELSL